MAEGWLLKFGGDRFAAQSAGIEAHGKNPFAIAVMDAAGVDRLMLSAPAKVEPVTIAKPFALIRNAMGLPPTATPGAVVPVYVTVRVPGKAAAGRYRGKLTIFAKGANAVTVPVECFST